MSDEKKTLRVERRAGGAAKRKIMDDLSILHGLGSLAPSFQRRCRAGEGQTLSRCVAEADDADGEEKDGDPGQAIAQGGAAGAFPFAAQESPERCRR